MDAENAKKWWNNLSFDDKLFYLSKYSSKDISTVTIGDVCVIFNFVKTKQKCNKLEAVLQQ
jgi:hypothetical protein